jgi:hypothetical protein
MLTHTTILHTFVLYSQQCRGKLAKRSIRKPTLTEYQQYLHILSHSCIDSISFLPSKNSGPKIYTYKKKLLMHKKHE